MADKPFEATSTWIARAKRQGNVARSQELCAICAFLLGAIAIATVAPLYGNIDRNWIVRAAADGSVHLEYLAPLFGLVAAVFVIAACGGITAAILQEKPFFIAPKLKPDRLNPVEGLKRMFSREALVAAARAVLAFVLALGAVSPTAQEVFARGAGFASIGFFAAVGASAGARIVAAVILVGAAFAIADVLLVRGRWRKKLRMTAYELKRDLRENDGDPMLKGRRRMMHRAVNKAGAAIAVKRAAFVVTNPTHIAMALEYAPPQVAVPRVLVRAADENAARVRELARRYGVPLIENVSLARELYALTEPGDEIPVETYVAVAAIVNALSQRRPA